MLRFREEYAVLAASCQIWRQLSRNPNCEGGLARSWFIILVGMGTVFE